MADKNVSVKDNLIKKKIPDTSISVVQKRDPNSTQFKTLIWCDHNFKTDHTYILNSSIRTVYESLLTLSDANSRKEVLNDVIEVYRHANENVDEAFLDEGITELANKYTPWAGKANTTFSLLYLIMLGEINKFKNFEFDKAYSLLGSYQVLAQGMSPAEAAVDTKSNGSYDAKLNQHYHEVVRGKLDEMERTLRNNGYDI